MAFFLTCAILLLHLWCDLVHSALKDFDIIGWLTWKGSTYSSCLKNESMSTIIGPKTLNVNHLTSFFFSFGWSLVLLHCPVQVCVSAFTNWVWVLNLFLLGKWFGCFKRQKHRKTLYGLGHTHFFKTDWEQKVPFEKREPKKYWKKKKKSIKWKHSHLSNLNL